MDGHLGRTMDGHAGCDLTAQPYNTQILHDESIHTALGSMSDQGDHITHFFIGYQGVQGQMDGDTPDMAIFDSLSQSLGRKVFGTLAGIELPAA